MDSIIHFMFIIEGFLLTFKGVINDHEINNHDVVCIGYRWPSEQIFAPVRTALRAAPNFLIGLFFVPVLVLLAVYLLSFEKPGLFTIIAWIVGPCLFLVAISVTTFILRIAVYFRDGYRASSYGVPDLVEIIQQIDKKYLEKEPKAKNDDGQLKR